MVICRHIAQTSMVVMGDRDVDLYVYESFALNFPSLCQKVSADRDS
jgi:hypothetical protein